MQTRIFASPSPHIHGSERTQQIMGDVVLALIPALAVSTYVLGWRVLMITAISIVSCMLFEYLIQRFLLKGRTTLGDLSDIQKRALKNKLGEVPYQRIRQKI